MKKFLKKRNKAEHTLIENAPSEAGDGLSGNPDAVVARMVLNGKTVKQEEFYRKFTAVLRPEKLTAFGGILFKAGLSGNTFFLGILPNFHEGERGYHHDIHLPEENEFTLVGGITAQRELTILFKCTEMTDEKRKEYRRVYRVLAGIVDQCDGDDTVSLDWITVKLIEEQRVFQEIPKNLADIFQESADSE